MAFPRRCSIPSPRWLVSRLALAVIALCVSTMLVFYALPHSRWKYPPLQRFEDYLRQRMPAPEPLVPLADRVPCYGPRGKVLSASPDDELRSVELNTSYPAPFFGSHSELRLEQSWMTADGRYGPYGYGEDDEGYNRSKVDWDNVDWKTLQNQCFGLNKQRFPEGAAEFANDKRFALRADSKLPKVRTWDEFSRTRRTAIVVRAYTGYTYKPEDMFNLRSLIVETSLRTGGEYTVVLLVNIRGKESNIFESEESYAKAFEDANIPKEFQSIALLWDENFLRSWYPKILEYRTEWQVFQPLQLFALHYPEFDHYWQLEMDQRFLGDAGKYLDTVSAYARAEPRKQSLERSSFPYVPAVDGDRANFSAAVDAANSGGSLVWGPLRIPDVIPIGPVPPFERAEDDVSFEWGVGEDADALATSYCANATASPQWVFRDWIYGFRNGKDTPRFFCPPAIMRSSRALLLAVHAAQLVKGLRVPSEATLPSFALWHGLKLSFPPHPVYIRQRDDDDIRAGWHKGGPANSTRGLGPAYAEHPPGDGLTWWWESKWPRAVVDAWFGAEGGAEADGGKELPYLLTQEGGLVYAPNVAMHPVKTQ